MVVTAYLIFFVAGLGFGFAAPGGWKWLPLSFPLALSLLAWFQEGVGGGVVVSLIVALLITVAGILLGALLERRESGDRAPRVA